MILANIRKALETRLAALAPSWVTAYEGVPFEPTQGVNYQEVTLLPGSPVTPGVFGSAIRHVGLFQVMVCTANRGGPNVADERAAAVQAHFKRGTSLAVTGLAQNLWVPDHPIIGPALVDEAWRRVPVTISWNAFEAG